MPARDLAKNTIFMTNLALFNLGCEAILRGTIRIIRETISPDIKFAMPSYHVQSDQERLSDMEGIEVIPMSACQGIRRFFSRKLGLFCKYWTPRFTPTFFDSDKVIATLSVGGDIYTLYNNDLPWDWIKMGDYCNKRDVPYVIWGATMESFEKRPDLLDELLAHLRSCRLITIRDHRTVEYLASHGVVENVREVFDPAFCMDPIVCDIEPFMPERKTELCVGLNLSPLSARYHNKSDLIEQTVHAVELFVEATGQSIVLVSHVITPTLNPSYDDRAFHNKIYQKIANKYQPFIGNANQDIGSPRMKYLISQLDGFAGTRMHSTIAALSTCVPTISLAYSEKAFGLNSMFFGDEVRWILPIPEFSAELCSKRLKELLYNRQTVRSDLESRVDEVKARSMQAGKFLFEAISLDNFQN